MEQKVNFANDGSIDEQTTYRYDQNDRLLEESLDSDGDGVVDQTTLYGYTGTQQTGKDVHTGDSDDAVTSSTLFTYNLQGRMDSVTIESYDGEIINRREVSIYEYNSLGIRVSAETVVLEDTDQDPGTELQETSHTRTEFLNDPHNPTGYSQVLQETEFNAEGDIVKRIVYTLGHDQISQTTYAYIAGVADAVTTLFFGSDGHGSTRALLNALGAIETVDGILQIFHFDAYGNAIGFDPETAATTILYSGEMFDVNTGLQYLRARYYNPATGTFNRLDPFTGNIHDPQSFHKYLYTHADPVNLFDPLGLFGLVSSMAASSIGSAFNSEIGSAGFDIMAELLPDNALLAARTAFQQELARRLPAFITIMVATNIASRQLGRFARHAAIGDLGMIAFGELDELKRPTGVYATITGDMISTDTKANPKIIPPGFAGGSAGHARGHLLGAQLGGRYCRILCSREMKKGGVSC